MPRPASSYSDEQITARGRQALSEYAPYSMRRKVDPNDLRFVQGKVGSGHRYASSAQNDYAGVEEGDPNVIHVEDVDAFMNPTNTPQLALHEYTHIFQNRLHPSVQAKLPPIREADPYALPPEGELAAAAKAGANSLQLSREQQAALAQQYAALLTGYRQARARGKVAPEMARQFARAKQIYEPYLNHLASQPLTVLQPTAPNDRAINLRPNDPGLPAAGVAGMESFEKASALMPVSGNYTADDVEWVKPGENPASGAKPPSYGAEDVEWVAPKGPGGIDMSKVAGALPGMGKPAPAPPLAPISRGQALTGHSLSAPVPATPKEPSTPTVSAAQPTQGQAIQRTLANSAVGRSLQSTMPRVASALGLEPTATESNPDAARDAGQLLAPEYLAQGIGRATPSAPASTAENVATGALKGLGGMTTPGMLATAAAPAGEIAGAIGPVAARLVPRLLSAGFTLSAIQGLYDSAPAYREAVARGDKAAAQEIAGGMIVDAAMAALAGRHAMGEPIGHANRGEVLPPEAKPPVASMGAPEPATVEGHPAGKVTGIDQKTGLPIVDRESAPRTEGTARAQGENPASRVDDVPRGRGAESAPLGTEAESGRPVLQGSAKAEELRQEAERKADAFRGALEEAAEGVPGARVEAVREAKDAERVAEKAHSGKPVETQPDHLAGRIVADTPQAKEQVAANLAAAGELGREDNFAGPGGTNGFRADTHQVEVGGPGEALRSAEAQILTPEQHAASQATHDLYERQRTAETQGDEATAARLGDQIRAVNDAAARAAEQRQKGLDSEQRREVPAVNALATQEAAQRLAGEPGRAERTGAEIGRIEDAAGKGKPIPGVAGSATSLLTPSRQIPARYRLVEADSLQPSHDARTFARNPRYPEGVQERAYDTSKEAQSRVIQQAQNYDPRYTVNTNPDAVNGPPVVTPSGIVLGGNSRAMSTQRLYAGEGGERYKRELARQADSFGLTPDQVRSMRHPVLVREVPEPATHEDARRLGAELNKSMTGALGVSERAVSAGKNIRPETLREVSDLMQRDDSTLREMMARHGGELTRMLVRDGAITERERPQFIDTTTGGLSEEGKTFVERALLGSALDDPRLMDAAPKSILLKLERSLGAIASFGSRADEWNVLPALRAAVAEHASIQQSESTVATRLGQTSMFGGERNPVVDALVRALDRKPNEVREALQAFARDADANQPGQTRMFGGGFAFEAFNHAFGSRLSEKEYAHGLEEAATSAPSPAPEHAAPATRDEGLPAFASGEQAPGREAGGRGVRSQLQPSQRSAEGAKLEGFTWEDQTPVLVTDPKTGQVHVGTIAHFNHGENGSPRRARIALADGGRQDGVREENLTRVARPEMLSAEPITSDPAELAIRKRTEEHGPALVARYLRKNTRAHGVISIATDAAKELFPEFQADPTGNDRIVASSASAVSKAALKTALAAHPVDGRRTVRLNTASPGSGKTASLLSRAGSDIGIDLESILDEQDAASKLIRQILDSGRTPAVTWIFVDDPAKTVQRMITRAVGHDGKPGIGRTVQLEYMAHAYTELPKTLEALKKEFGDDITIRVIDNSGKPGEEVYTDQLSQYTQRIRGTEAQNLEAMYAEFHRLQREGKVPEAVARAATDSDRGSQGAYPGRDRGRNREIDRPVAQQPSQGLSGSVLDANPPKSEPKSSQQPTEDFREELKRASQSTLRENAIVQRSQVGEFHGRKMVVLDADGMALWHRALKRLGAQVGAGVSWRGMTLDKGALNRALVVLEAHANTAATQPGGAGMAEGFRRMARSLEEARNRMGGATLLRGDHRADTAHEEAVHLWQMETGLARSAAMREVAERPEFVETARRLREMGYDGRGSDPNELANEMMAKALANDPDLRATEEQRYDLAHAFLSRAVEDEGPEVLRGLPETSDPAVQAAIREARRTYGDHGGQDEGGARQEDGGELRAGDGQGARRRGEDHPGPRGQRAARDLQPGAQRAGEEEGELGPRYQKRLPGERPLPGMERAVEEQDEAAAERRGEELTEELRRSKGDISRKAGEMERESPLFRDTDANPQGRLFQRDADEDHPVWYLKSEKLIAEKMRGPMSGDALLSMLRNGGVKADELKWTALDDLQGKPKVTPEEARGKLAENNAKLMEVTKAGDPLSVKEWQTYNALRTREREAPGTLTAEDWQRIEELEDRAALPKGGGTKFSTYQLPGGENYREMLLTLPERGVGGISGDGPRDVRIANLENELDRVQEAMQPLIDDPERSLPGWPHHAELDRLNAQHRRLSHALEEEHRRGGAGGVESLNFKSNHWDEPNVVAHLRFNDRTAADGKRLLHLEEIQSDWHQEGRDKGYQQGAAIAKDAKLVAKQVQPGWYEVSTVDGRFVTNVTDPAHTKTPESAIAEARRRIAEEPTRLGADKRVPDAPWKKDWHEMAFRRMVRYAAEHGYDGVSWTPGEQQAERYDLSKQVQSVGFFRTGTDTFDILARDHSGARVLNGTYAANQLPDVVGKELAQKIVDDPRGSGTLSGVDLKVGGEGMKGFYDKIVPEYANKFGKRWGARVGKTEVAAEPGKTQAVPYLPVTPEMEESVTREGVPLFQREGAENATEKALEELTRRLAELPEEKLSAKEQVEESLGRSIAAMKKQASWAEQALADFPGQIKKAWDLWKGLPEHTEYKQALGRKMLYETQVALRQIEFARQIRRVAPRDDDQIAITHYLQADGDEKVLRQQAAETRAALTGWRERTAAEKAERERLKKAGTPKEKMAAALEDWRRAVQAGQGKGMPGNPRSYIRPLTDRSYHYELATRLTPEQKKLAMAIKQFNDDMLRAAQDEGVLHAGARNYVHQVYDKESAARLATAIATDELNPNPSFVRRRVFQSYFEAENAGMTPKDKRIGFLTSVTAQSMAQAISDRRLLRSLLEAPATPESAEKFYTVGGAANTGPKPFVLRAKGSDEVLGRYATEAEAWKAAEERKGSARRPVAAMRGTGHWVIANEHEAKQILQPMVSRSATDDYVSIDAPQLKNFLWAPTVEDLESLDPKLFEDDPKRLAFRGSIVIHPSYASHVRALVEGSYFHSDKAIAKVGKAALTASTLAKESMVLASPFHQMFVSTAGLMVGVNPLTLPEIDLDEPEQRELVMHGLNVLHVSPEGLFSVQHLSKLLGGVPVASEVLRRMENYSNYLFQDYLPKIKMQAARNMLGLNKKLYAKKFSPDQIAEMTAKQANNLFGGLNHKMNHLARHKTGNDLLRLFLFAPDFEEGNLRFAASALSPTGAVPLGALAGAALIMWTGARAMNMLLNHGDPHFDQPFGVVFHGRVYSLRSPITILLELFDDTRSFFYNRMNPMGLRPVVQLLTGRDKYGRQKTVGSTAGDVVKQVAPITVQKVLQTSDETWGDSILSAFGINASVYRTPTEEKVHRLYLERISASPEDPAHKDAGRKAYQMTEKLREHKMTTSELWKQVGEGHLSAAQARRIYDRAQMSELAYEYEHLKFADALKVYEKATLAEKLELRPILARKARAAVEGLPEPERGPMETKISSILLPAGAR